MPEDMSSGRTVAALLDRMAGMHTDKTFLVTEDEELTYRQLVLRSGSTAAALMSFGVERGDRVLAVLPNCADFVLLLLACARMGAVFVPVNPRSADAELAAIAAQARPRIIVVENAGREDLDRSVPTHEARALCTGTADMPQSKVDANDTFLLIPTSGSTSAPKLVAQHNAGAVLAAEGFPAWLGLSASDRLLTPLPLFHGNALNYSLLGSLAAGASLVILPRFSARRFWGQAREFGATQFNAMGIMGEVLLRSPRRENDADNPVRICYSAWALPEERHRAFERRFGLDLVVGYGLSETPYGTVWPLGEPKPFGSIGRLRQHPTLGVINEARVVNDDREDVHIGKPGRLLLRNPAIMQGYYGLPEQTEMVIQDGWLDTGDIVRQDARGFFYFVGRAKEIIRRSGENFAPIEVEEVIDENPEVLLSAVVPVPSPMFEDDAKAFVVRRDDSRLTERELLEWCRPRIAQFKLPRYVEFVGELPMTQTNRVAKGRLPRTRTPAEVDLEGLRRGPA